VIVICDHTVTLHLSPDPVNMPNLDNLDDMVLPVDLTLLWCGLVYRVPGKVDHNPLISSRQMLFDYQ
jgi:hypothetical protein